MLDIGVGTGRLLASVSGVEKHGIDVSLNYLQRLVGGDVELAQGSIEALPYKDGYFDVVTCTDVLEHVVDLNQALRELRRVLRPGGAAVLRVPYLEDLAPYLHPDFPYQFAHLRNFDESSLRLLLEKVAGFEVSAVHLDRAFIAAKLTWPLPRGMQAFTTLAAGLSRRRPAWRNFLHGCYRPVEITVVATKRLD